MSYDPLATVGSIRQLAGTLSGLGTALQSAAPTGSFQAVLDQVSSQMASVEDPQAASAASSTFGPEASSLLAPSTSPGLGSLLETSMGSPAALGSSALTGSAVVADAEQYLGVPYVWGGTTPAGFDCSGLVQHVYADLGVSLPRTSQEQATVGAPVPSLADAQPGDLVFFAGSDGTASSPGHVGIYMGNGMMIDAPYTGANVRMEPVGQPVAIRRILPSVGGPLAGAGGVAGPYGNTSLAELAGSLLGPAGAAYSSSGPGMQSLGVPPELQPLFAEAGARYGIDPLVLAAVAKQESGFQPGAVSSAGAQGLMQLMPATAAGLGVSPLDPAQAIDGAAQLLSGYLNDYGGSVPLALAAYNAGPGAVAQYGGVPPYAQTQNYVASITSMLDMASTGGVAA